jgi:hypothetical protein
MELIEFHFRAGLDFTGQFPGWSEVEDLPGFGVGEALDHAGKITKKENRRKGKSQRRHRVSGVPAKVARPRRGPHDNEG